MNWNIMRAILLLLSLSTSLPSYSESNTVLVEGRGDTLNDALFDAFSTAVLQSGQAFVSSQLDVSNGRVSKDYQSFVSSGFIQSYEIKKHTQSNNSSVILVQCVVNAGISYPESPDILIPNTDLSLLKANQRIFREKISHIDNLVVSLPHWFNSVYSLDFKSYQVTTSSGENVSGYYLFQLNIDHLKLKTLRSTLRAIGGQTSDNPTFQSYGFFERGSPKHLSFTTLGIDPAILSHLPGLITAKIAVGNSNLWLSFFLDMAIYYPKGDSPLKVRNRHIYSGNKKFGLISSSPTNLFKRDCPLLQYTDSLLSPQLSSIWLYSSRYRGYADCASNPTRNSPVFIRIPFTEPLDSFDEAPEASLEIYRAEYADALYPNPPSSNL